MAAENISDATVDKFSSAVEKLSAALEKNADITAKNAKVSGEFQRALTQNTKLVKENEEAEKRYYAAWKNVYDLKTKNLPVSNELTKKLKEEKAAVEELAKAIKAESEAEKAFQKEMQTSEEKLKKYGDRISNVKSGIKEWVGMGKSMLTFITAQSISMAAAKDALVKYNQSTFELSRSMTQMGRSMGDVDKIYGALGKSTTMSKNEFLDFANTVHKGYKGITPTTEAIAKLSANLKTAFGPDVEKQKEGFKSLMDIQSEFPDLYEEIDRVRNKMTSGSASKDEIEHAKDMIMYQGMITGASKEAMDKQLQYLTNTSSAENKQLDVNEKLIQANKEVANTMLEVGRSLSGVFGKMADAVGGLAHMLGGIPGIVASISVAFIALSAVMNTKLGGMALDRVKKALIDRAAGGAAQASAGGGGLTGSIGGFLNQPIFGKSKEGAITAENMTTEELLKLKGNFSPSQGIGKGAGLLGRVGGVASEVGAAAGPLEMVASAGVAGWEAGKAIDSFWGTVSEAFGGSGRTLSDRLGTAISKGFAAIKIPGFDRGMSDKEAKTTDEETAKMKKIMKERSDALRKVGEAERTAQLAVSEGYRKQVATLDAVIKRSSIVVAETQKQLSLLKEMSLTTPTALLAGTKAIRTAADQMMTAGKKTYDLYFGAGGMGSRIAADLGVSFAGVKDALSKSNIPEAIAELSAKSTEGMEKLQEKIKATTLRKEAAEALPETDAERAEAIRKADEELRTYSVDMATLEGIVGKTQEGINKMAEAQKTAFEAARSAMGSLWDQAKGYNSTIASRIDMEKELMEAAQFGMGASITMMQKQVGMAEKNIQAIQKQKEWNDNYVNDAIASAEKQLGIEGKIGKEGIKTLKEKLIVSMSLEETQSILAEKGIMYNNLDSATKATLIEYGRKENELTKDQMEQQKKIYDITKNIREGYLDAMAEMSVGAGKFSKIIGTQEMGASQLMRVVDELGKAPGALNTMKLGGRQGKGLTAAGVGVSNTGRIGVSEEGGVTASWIDKQEQTRRNERYHDYQKTVDDYNAQQKGQGAAATVGTGQAGKEYLAPLAEQSKTGTVSKAKGFGYGNGSTDVLGGVNMDKVKNFNTGTETMRASDAATFARGAAGSIPSQALANPEGFMAGAMGGKVDIVVTLSDDLKGQVASANKNINIIVKEGSKR